MGKRLLFLLLFTFLTNARSIEENQYQFNLGPLFNYARYNLGCLPKIHGYLAGIHADFQLNTPSCIYTEIDFDARFNAGFICGCDDTKSKIRDYKVEWFLGYNWDGLGERWSACQDVTLTPFAGVGFYFLSNELKPNIIDYRYFNVFVPLGFKAHWDVCSDTFAVELQALYRADAHTQAEVDTPCIDDEDCDCEKLCLNRSHGVHVEVPLIWNDICTWEIGGCETEFQMKVVPFFDWNRFGSAAEVNSNDLCIEVPQLDRWHLGLHVDFGILF